MRVLSRLRRARRSLIAQSMPPPLFPGAEGLGFRRWMIAVVACILAIWAGVTLADSPYMVFAGFAGLLYVGTLSVNARTLAWLVIALEPAALIVPFFPGRPFWWELCALLAWPSLLAFFLVNRQKLADLKFDRLERQALIALSGYLVVLLGLMLYRGVGFRVLGGAQMGGRFYVQQVILAIVPLLMITAGLSRKQLLWATAIGWSMSLTYLVSDFAFSMSGGVMQRILYFIEVPTDAVNFVVGYEVTGMRRYQSLWYVAAAGLACIWTLAPLRDLLGKYVLIAGPFMLGLLALGLGSGHRTLLILALTTLIFLTVFQRFWNPLRAVVGILVTTFAVIVLYATADQLPMPIQRSISFLPGIEVQALAERNAVDTLNDRIGILKLAINDVPRYLVLGRGFGMERFDKLPGDVVQDNVWMGYINGYFYNGTLGLLLKTGLPGFLFSSLFVWWASRMALELVRLVWRRSMHEQTWFDRFCFLVCAQWFALLIFFYLTHGDASLWMQDFALPAALIMICRRRQLQDESVDLVDAPSHATSGHA
jgi:hypothetical protein